MSGIRFKIAEADFEDIEEMASCHFPNDVQAQKIKAAHLAHKMREQKWPGKGYFRIAVRVTAKGQKIVIGYAIFVKYEVANKAEQRDIEQERGKWNSWGMLNHNMSPHQQKSNASMVALNHVEVHPAYRGKGVGTRLVDDCISKIGHHKIFIHSASPIGQKLYEKYSFQKTTIEKEYPGGMEFWRMVREPKGP